MAGAVVEVERHVDPGVPHLAFERPDVVE